MTSSNADQLKAVQQRRYENTIRGLGALAIAGVSAVLIGALVTGQIAQVGALFSIAFLVLLVREV